MIITDEKIRVTDFMMSENNMLRSNKFGVPVDPSAPEKGLEWKGYFELTEDDFDAIETYFINKKNTPPPLPKNPETPG